MMAPTPFRMATHAALAQTNAGRIMHLLIAAQTLEKDPEELVYVAEQLALELSALSHQLGYVSAHIGAILERAEAA
jgi:hypothetical protein